MKLWFSWLWRRKKNIRQVNKIKCHLWMNELFNDSLNMYLFYYWMNQHSWTNLLHDLKTHFNSPFLPTQCNWYIFVWSAKLLSKGDKLYQSLYLNYYILSQYFLIWKDCEAVSFMTDKLLSLGQRQRERRFKCSNHTGVIVQWMATTLIAHVKGWEMKQTNYCHLGMVFHIGVCDL